MLDRISNIRKARAANQKSTSNLYGVSLYGADGPHLRYAATRYATEARKLLESLLPGTRHTSTKSGANNVNKIEATTINALTYAAESRRLLASAEAIEEASKAEASAANPLGAPLYDPTSGINGRPSSFQPPTSRFKFSCALNLITTELSPEDTEVARDFIHYAKRARDTRKEFAGDDRAEQAEYECQRIINANVPNLVDEEEEAKRARRAMMAQRSNKRCSVWPVVIACAVVAVLGLSGYGIHQNRANSAGGGGGGDVSSASDSYWNDPDAFVTATPTSFPTSMPTQDVFTMEPTPYSSEPPVSAPTSSANTNPSSGNAGNEALMTQIRQNPWAWGGIAAMFGISSALVAWVIARRKNKMNPMICAHDLEDDDDEDTSDDKYRADKGDDDKYKSVEMSEQRQKERRMKDPPAVVVSVSTESASDQDRVDPPPSAVDSVRNQDDDSNNDDSGNFQDVNLADERGQRVEHTSVVATAVDPSLHRNASHSVYPYPGYTPPRVDDGLPPLQLQ